jgi:hypothetical protein
VGQRQAEIESQLRRLQELERQRDDLLAILDLIGQQGDPELEAEWKQGMQTIESSND